MSLRNFAKCLCHHLTLSSLLLLPFMLPPFISPLTDFHLLSAVDRLQALAGEQLGQTQEELDDRDNFHTEVVQTLSWLSDTQHSLLSMDPDADDVAENVDKCKVRVVQCCFMLSSFKHIKVQKNAVY